MATTKRQPGEVRDAIMAFLSGKKEGASVAEIVAGVEARIGPVARSSVRSYLQLNAGRVFERLHPGVYRIRVRAGRIGKA